MEENFHGLPPSKRFRLLQKKQEEEFGKVGALNYSRLPAKKRKESRDAVAPTVNYPLPAKKRVWALVPDFLPKKTVSPFDPNLDLLRNSDGGKEIDVEDDSLHMEVLGVRSEKLAEAERESKLEDEVGSPSLMAENRSAKITEEENDRAEEEAEEDGIVCSVCQSTDGDPTDPIVFCDGCDLMVHKSCYGDPLRKGIPEGDWFCIQCSFSRPSKTRRSRSPFSCFLCPAKNGAMKPTKDGKWAHVVCALFVPEVFFEDPEGREGIDCSKVPVKRREGKCCVCGVENGCVVDCSEMNCPLAFHVTCALKEEMFMEYREGKRKGATSVVAAFCKEHTELWKKQEQTGKFKIVARE